MSTLLSEVISSPCKTTSDELWKLAGNVLPLPLTSIFINFSSFHSFIHSFTLDSLGLSYFSEYELTLAFVVSYVWEFISDFVENITSVKCKQSNLYLEVQVSAVEFHKRKIFMLQTHPPTTSLFEEARERLMPVMFHMTNSADYLNPCSFKKATHYCECN